MVDKGQNLNLKDIFHIEILYFEKKLKTNFNQVQEKKNCHDKFSVGSVLKAFMKLNIKC